MFGKVRIQIESLERASGAVYLRDDLALTVIKSECYRFLLNQTFPFCLKNIVSYQIGKFYGGSNNGAWIDAIFEFPNLSDENKMLLMLSQTFEFLEDEILEGIRISRFPVPNQKWENLPAEFQG